MAPQSEVSGVPGTRFSSIRIVESTGSTNADLLSLAESGAPEGAVLVTQHQTAGRGRQGRTWLDQPGASLLVSWLLRPDSSVAGLIPLATGLAVHDALARLGIDDVGLKWPNDVLAVSSEQKLAGILAEATTAGGSFAAVVGMGMNRQFIEAPPVEVAERAIDLATLTGGEPPEPLDLLRLILAEVERRLQQLAAGRVGCERLLDDYTGVCLTLGRSVTLETPTGELHGTATSIDPSGGLVVAPGNGEAPVVVTAGDAHHAAPSP